VCAFLKLYNVSEIDLKPIQIEVTNNTNMPSLCKYIVKESKIPSSNPHPLFPHPHTDRHTHTHTYIYTHTHTHHTRELPHTHTHTHIFIYIYIHTHTHTHSSH